MAADPTIRLRARRFLQTTAFETMPGGAIAGAAQPFEMMSELLAGADVRRDFRREGSNVDPADVVLEERVLPVGVESSVHGPWSSSRKAIVAPGRMGRDGAGSRCAPRRRPPVDRRRSKAR